MPKTNKSAGKLPPVTPPEKPSGPPIFCAYGELRPVAELREHPQNPNRHPEEQVRLLAKVIAGNGWRSPIVVSKRSGFITKGHGRLAAARLAGMAVAPVDVQDYADEAAELADMVADNQASELSEMDPAALKDLIERLDTGERDMETLGISQEQLEEMMTAEHEDTDVDAEAQIDKADELREKWGVELGQLWGLGEHRLLCGDSQLPRDVKIVMDGAFADMMITDPPYGVAYVGKTKDALTVENDDVNEETLSAMCKEWFDCAWEATRDGAYWVATVPAGPLHGVFFNDWKTRGILRQVMVWNKDSMVLGHSEYHYKHEPILFGWKPGKRLMNDDRTKTTVWDFKRPKASREHPTMKPVEMWSYAIGNHTRPNNLVYEPFSGSGTTIIACEQLGRKCRAIEISPAYVAVAIQRWHDATGKDPVKIS